MGEACSLLIPSLPFGDRVCVLDFRAKEGAALQSLAYFKSADSGCYKLVASSYMFTKECNKISRLFCFIYVSLSNISDRILKNVP